MYQEAKIAKDQNGKPIRVGDKVSFEGNREVIVTKIHRQGFDGTILSCEPSPSPEYQYHKSCRASKCVKL